MVSLVGFMCPPVSLDILEVVVNLKRGFLVRSARGL